MGRNKEGPARAWHLGLALSVWEGTGDSEASFPHCGAHGSCFPATTAGSERPHSRVTPDAAGKSPDIWPVPPTPLHRAVPGRMGWRAWLRLQGSSPWWPPTAVGSDVQPDHAPRGRGRAACTLTLGAPHRRRPGPAHLRQDCHKPFQGHQALPLQERKLAHFHPQDVVQGRFQVSHVDLGAEDPEGGRERKGC